ncbi:rhamnogalacturonan lyase [Fibrivirga algicola]|uniref:Rhamnogalacturonan lyase n=1 Tax=Fibrivirga algicola TaxID=2950420 RepID=A0ABX0QG42_9BACT|nr:rhamnogalacturonan lyase [Fibrivirga algicola]NID10027.1 rhamnogalacturonan lyase [Fibrivirga algicola]
MTLKTLSLLLLSCLLPTVATLAQRQMERLNRGVVAVRTSAEEVYVGWRLFGTDPADIAFNVYRGKTRVNVSPITGATNLIDRTSASGTYTVRAVVNGKEQAASEVATVWAKNYLSIPIQAPASGATTAGQAYSYVANDCSVGDLDGNGDYEIVVKWDPSNAQDNSRPGVTGNVYLDVYKLNGTRLWRIDLGRNIRAGAHYTQFMVYDLDSDGKAEIACRTADGTIDGKGKVIGDASADHRNEKGFVLKGPEFLTIFNGQTGAAMASTTFLPQRDPVGGDNPTDEQMRTTWGDANGNRIDRFISTVAYLDGQRPSLVMGRGYYTRLVRVAWDWRNGKLTQRWLFDSDSSPENRAYRSQGNHQLTTGDVDGDGKDEVINGSSVIDDDGKGLYANGLGHGDALHMSDMDPDRPGQEVWQCHESPRSYGDYGLEFRDAKTGQPLWGVPGTGDIGRSLAADIDPTHKGYECWGATGGLYDCKGQQIGTKKPPVNFAIWWDGDLSRELLDGPRVSKWDPATNMNNRLFSAADMADGVSNNSTKANPGVTADLLGDWREEIVYRNSTSTELLLFTTTDLTTTRLFTLMHDAQYRVAVAHQNSAYNQPPHPSFYLGTDMVMPPPPNIVTKAK